MSTRALYTFIGENASDTWNVYKHCDGYPTGAADVLKTAQDIFAWKLPRFEADEFAAAFIAAGKCTWLSDGKFDPVTFEQYAPGGKYHAYKGGNVRLMPQGNPLKIACANCRDIEYRYEISAGQNNMGYIHAFSVDAWHDPGKETLLFECPLFDFPKKARAYEKKLAKV